MVVLIVPNYAQLSLNASDLAYLFGQFVDIVGIALQPKYAHIYVPTLRQAAHAISELHGRFLGEQARDPLLVHKRSCSFFAEDRLFKPAIGTAPRPELDAIIWHLYVRNIPRELADEQLFQLFRPFGTVLRWYRHVTRTYGNMLLKTVFHWRKVEQKLDGIRLAGGHRLRVAFVCKAFSAVPDVAGEAPSLVIFTLHKVAPRIP